MYVKKTLPILEVIEKINQHILEELGLTTIPPMSCTQLEFDISSFVNGILHVKFTGDYLVGVRPLRRKLEIEVVCV